MATKEQICDIIKQFAAHHAPYTDGKLKVHFLENGMPMGEWRVQRTIGTDRSETPVEVFFNVPITDRKFKVKLMRMAFAAQALITEGLDGRQFFPASFTITAWKMKCHRCGQETTDETFVAERCCPTCGPLEDIG